MQVNRNGIRSIAVGTGDLGKLSLPYLTVESDVKAGDLLVSSGLDGIFPAGYPVARITKVERDPAETFAVVEAKPLAQLDRDPRSAAAVASRSRRRKQRSRCAATVNAPAATPRSRRTPAAAKLQRPMTPHPPHGTGSWHW